MRLGRDTDGGILEKFMDENKFPLWEIRNISKAFPGVQALDNVSFPLYMGEVHALVGENGSGKSTMAKCLSGAHLPDSGQILYQGKPIIFHNPLEARAHGVATIYQEFSLVPSLSVAENIFLGRYPRKPGSGLIDWATMRQETVKILKQLSLKIDPDAIVKGLSVAEQQLVEIAKAISTESSLLIMDEPTAALGMLEIQVLMELIRRLIAQNKAIIYISHRLDEVFEIADRVTILKDGKKVKTTPLSESKMADVVHSMIGYDIQQHYPKEKNIQAVTCLEVESLTTENGVNDVSFSINIGEVFGLGGMLGSGRTEIARAVYGLERINDGKILLFGREVRFNSPAEAIVAGVGMLPENRKVDGCFFNFDGPKNITISHLSELLSGPFLNLVKELKVGKDYIDRLNISPAALEKTVQFLSGGNQQKVIIARWLFSQARVLIMDEPTQGIDIGAKLEVYKVINELTAHGISIILISSDFPELLAMCDRVAVVRDGSILYIVEGQRLTEYQLMSIASGVGISGEVENWMQLRKIAYPHLKVLRDRTKMAAHLAVLDRSEMTLYYLVKVGDNTPSMLSRSGVMGPLHCTDLGKVLLAHEPANVVNKWIKNTDLHRYTENTITDPVALKSELKTIRAQGFSLDQEEYENGIRCIAAPIEDSQGNVIAAINVSVPIDKLPIDLVHSPFHDAIDETARAISQDFATRKQDLSLNQHKSY